MLQQAASPEPPAALPRGTSSQQTFPKLILVVSLSVLQSPFSRASKLQDLGDAIAFTLARRPKILGLHWQAARRLSHLADRLLQKLGFAPGAAIFTTVSKKVFI